MRWSRYYLFTTREVPADAEVVSHRLMVRAGMIRKEAAGIYSYLPFGWRSLQKLSAIVRRELDGAGAIELHMPVVHDADLWRESGRWQAYGKELLRVTDRHERDFCLGPTHEEVVTDIVRRDVRSYRQLPVNLYQIQVKFRDEIRPRFGLMRGREFIMKDAYSFDADAAGLDAAYDEMDRAYQRIFDACQLDYSRVEADTGAIGGSSSHEFMVLADTGESEVVSCRECGYGANVERAETRPLAAPPAEEPEERREVSTPGCSSVAEVAELLGVEPERVVKTLLYDTPDGPVAVLIRGDRELNQIKLANHLGVPEVILAGEALVRSLSGAEVGFAGPVGLPDSVRIVADESVRGLANVVCGANRTDAHLTGVNFGRDVDLAEFADLLLVTAGDACPRCGSELALNRGIEVGHIFKLGTKYSDAMGCTYTDEQGQDHPMVMGCYGLGIGRTVAAAIEQNHDDKGIIWPLPLAPFSVLVLPLTNRDESVVAAAEGIYQDLVSRGVDVLLDDRDERPGVKFNDADLIGVPVRVVIGSKSLADGKAEISLRRDGEKELVAVEGAVERVLELTRTA